MSRTAKAKPRRTPRRRQHPDADPLLALANRWARAGGMHLAIWLARFIAIGLLPLQVVIAACVVFVSSFISGLWREASEIRKEQGTQIEAKKCRTTSRHGSKNTT